MWIAVEPLLRKGPAMRSPMTFVVVFAAVVVVAGAALAVPLRSGGQLTVVPPAFYAGTSRAETLTGTSANDVLLGRGGNDTLHGRGGNDVSEAAPATTALRRPRSRLLVGEVGNDRLYARDGARHGQRRPRLRRSWVDRLDVVRNVERVHRRIAVVRPTRTLRSALQSIGAGFKLAVVIPALNEAENVGAVVAAVPRRIPHVGEVEVIVVDDGSTDGTAVVALAAGADRVERHRRTAASSPPSDRMDAALARARTSSSTSTATASTIRRYIPRLVAPILSARRTSSSGCGRSPRRPRSRPCAAAATRSARGSSRRLMKMPISDATSGYRAFSREALLRLNVISEYTYTLETLIRRRVCVWPCPRSSSRRSAHQRRVADDALLARYIGHTGGQAFRTMLHANPLTFFGRAALAMLGALGGADRLVPLRLQSGGMHLPALLAALLTFVLAVGPLRVRADRGRDHNEPPPARGGAVPHEARGARPARRDSGRSRRAIRSRSRVAAPRAPVGAGRVTHDRSPQDRDRRGLSARLRRRAVQRGHGASDDADEPGRRDQLAAHVSAAALPRAGQRHVVRRAPVPTASFMLDWHDPRTWRRAIERVDAFESDALILPWLHPVMAPPYRYFLRHAPRRPPASSSATTSYRTSACPASAR